jgi:hypothetical protein
MAISFAALLIVLIALPFAGSCLAALFPANVRNAEAYLAGGVALTALVLVIAIYSQVVNRRKPHVRIRCESVHPICERQFDPPRRIF